jgi:hypothetical protein
MYSHHDTQLTEPFNPHGCPICVAILRLPHRGAFRDWEWTQCVCRYALRRYRCGHTVYLDPERGDKDLEEHICPPPVNPWTVSFEDMYPDAPKPQKKRAVVRW